jgi:hypothetical protein
MAEDPRLTNILKIIFGGGQPAEQDNSVAPTMSGGGDAVPALIIKNAIPPPVPKTPVAPEHTNILKMLFLAKSSRPAVGAHSTNQVCSMRLTDIEPDHIRQYYWRKHDRKVPGWGRASGPQPLSIC